MSKSSPRPKSGIPRPKHSNVVQKRKSAPPDGYLNANIDAVFQKQTDDDKYLTKRVVLNARRTGQLNLSGKGMAKVPERVWRLEEAEEEYKRLDQSFLKTELQEQSEEEVADLPWWERQALTSLDLSCNHIAVIPPELGTLVSLVSLDLHDNNLNSIPAELGTLGRLEQLNLSQNKIEKLPQSFFDLGELRTLSLAHNRITEISEDLGNLYRLETLSLSHNCLSALPFGIGFLTSLSRLDASHNKLTSVPPELSGLLGLTHLSLAHNELTSVPPLGDLRRLQHLDLQDNRLEAVPEVANCGALRELHLAANQITEISSDVLETMGHLRVLNLRENKIEEIPEDISHLQALVRLDLANNNLADIPSSIGFLPQLQLLAIEGNPLRKIRQDMVHCGSARLLRMLRGGSDSPQQSARVAVHLPRSDKPPLPDKYRMRGSRSLSLGMQGLTEIPDTMFRDAQEAEVETVDLCKNLLTALPTSLPLLAMHLTELLLSDNRLSELTPGILGQCQRLHYIDLQQNALSALPDDIAELSQLREINISYNRFTEVPNVLCTLPGLEILNARDNKITDIDAAQLGNIPRLTVLDLTNNDISVVPPELGNLHKLRSLSLEGNTFRIPRHEILAKGTACVLNYLRDRIPAGALQSSRGAPPDPPRQDSYTSHIVF